MGGGGGDGIRDRFFLFLAYITYIIYIYIYMTARSSLMNDLLQSCQTREIREAIELVCISPDTFTYKKIRITYTEFIL